MLVVVFHLWPGILPGGYIGVDVFFVISGFLITGQLLRSLTLRGSIDLPEFWARRVKRLLPASSVVLLATLASSLFLLPWGLLVKTAQQSAASALGVQNWVLAFDAVDYFGSQDLPTPVQQFWSLSLEEQFYLVWPVLLLLTFLAAKSLKAQRPARALFVVMAVVAVVSFALSVVHTAGDPAAAYFSTFTHAWELALGGMLAFFTPRLLKSRWLEQVRTRRTLSILGLGAIVASALVLNGESAFPGWVAIWPAMGAIAVIIAGEDSLRRTRMYGFGNPVIQGIGNSSYSIYLWHWPLIVLAPLFVGRETDLIADLILLALSLALGWVTWRFIEDPARRLQIPKRRTWQIFAAGSLVLLTTVSASVVVMNKADARGQQETLAAQQALDDASNAQCFGAAASENSESCATSHQVMPETGPSFAASDWGAFASEFNQDTIPDKFNCVDFSENQDGFMDCTIGASTSAGSMAIVGDSHALALAEPLISVGQSQGRNIRLLIRNSCTASEPMDYSDAARDDCNDWRRAMISRIADDESIEVVAATGFTRNGMDETFTGSSGDLVDGYAGAFEAWADAGKEVFAIEDVPIIGVGDVPQCIELSPQQVDPCTASMADALPLDPIVAAVSTLDHPAVRLVSLNDVFCQEFICHSVIGGVIAYRDGNHLSGTFAMTLVPRLAAELKK